MPTKSKYRQHFCIKTDPAYGFHIGAAFCVEGRDRGDENRKRDVYLLLYLGIIDIAVGFMTDYDEEIE